MANICDLNSVAEVSDGCLLGQVEVLQEEVLLRQQEVQTDSLLLAGLQEDMGPLLQQNGSHECVISAVQVNTQFDCQFVSKSITILRILLCQSMKTHLCLSVVSGL